MYIWWWRLLRWRLVLEASTSTKRYGRQLLEKNWSVGKREATEWIATLWQYSKTKRWSGMYHGRFHWCAIEDSGPFGFGMSFLVAGLKYCSNAVCGRYEVFLIDGSKQCNNLIIYGFNFRGCLSTAKTANNIPAIWYVPAIYTCSVDSEKTFSHKDTTSAPHALVSRASRIFLYFRRK